MNNILFVDDEPKILDGLRRMLRTERDRWNMEFVSTGEEALARLDHAVYDVVVSDMRMPGVDGAQVLNEVMRRHPQTMRIILSGQSDSETIHRSIGTAHRYLTKPCDAEQLRLTVLRSCALWQHLTDETLCAVVDRLKNLPSLPSQYRLIVEAMHAVDGSAKRVEAIIARDAARSAALLRMIRALYGEQILNIESAIAQLGVDAIKSLVLLVTVLSTLEGKAVGEYSTTNIGEHSLLVAAFARAIAEAEGASKEMLDHSYTAGLLHDLGQVVLAANDPVAYSNAVTRARKEQRPLWEAEQIEFGASHADISGFIMGLWGMSDIVVETALFHHTPTKASDKGFSPLVAVHVADSFAHERTLGELSELSGELQRDWLDQLGFSSRIEHWRTCCNKVCAVSSNDLSPSIGG